MREIVFALLGAFSGYKSIQRARVDITRFRSSGETFGHGSFTSHALSMPVVVLISSVLYLGMARAFTHDLTALTFGVLVGAGMWLALIDLDTHLLPRRIVYRTAALAVPLLTLSAFFDDVGSIGSMLLGGVSMWVVLQVCEVLSRGGIGKGDVSFAGLLGVYVGWQSLTAVLTALVAAFVAGGVVALGLLVTRRTTRSSRFAFGPFLFFGALVAVLR
jgi:leader peptidase (prepilin peptidase)/N-methyltransferase